MMNQPFYLKVMHEKLFLEMGDLTLSVFVYHSVLKVCLDVKSCQGLLYILTSIKKDIFLGKSCTYLCLSGVHG